MGFLHSPQRLWWRRAIFQIHLWVGIALCLYIAVIGITGSLLVFRSEIERASFRPLLIRDASDRSNAVQLADMVNTVRIAYPKRAVSIAYLPRHADENAIIMTSEKGKTGGQYVFVSPSTGKILGEIEPSKFWLFYVGQIHYFLLLGRTGLIVNGVGAAFLLLLTLSGLVMWWPGLRNWKRGLGVRVKASWRRINFDLHSSVGFWTLALLTIWSVSSIYFAWPEQIAHAVGRVSSVASLQQPRISVVPLQNAKALDLHVLINNGSIASPKAHLYGIFSPRGPRAPLTVLMARGKPGDFFNMDYVFVDPYTGKLLGTWHRGINPTWGSKLLFWLGPLHFGTRWGLLVKIIWGLLGMALPLLSITAVLMYWNRVLRKKWKALRQQTA